MTDRVKGLTVTFKDAIRVDDVDGIVNAIKMIKGVSDVTLGVENPDDTMNMNRVKSEIRAKFYEFANDVLWN